MVKTRYLIFLLSLLSPTIIKSSQPPQSNLEQLQKMLSGYASTHLPTPNSACTITHLMPIENHLCTILIARLNSSNMHNKLLLIAKLLTTQQFDTQFGNKGIVTIPAEPEAQGITVDRVIQRDVNFTLYTTKLYEKGCPTGHAYSFDYMGNRVPLDKIPLAAPSKYVEEISDR